MPDTSSLSEHDAKNPTQSNSLEARVLRTEWTLSLHAKAIDDLNADAKAIVRDLDGISKTLDQIKYFAMGAVAIYLADSIGIVESLKMIIGM